MPIKIDSKLTPQNLVPRIERMFELSAQKILSIVKTGVPSAGFHDFSMLRIFCADNSNIRSMRGTSFCGVSLESILMGMGWNVKRKTENVTWGRPLFGNHSLLR